MPEEKQDKQSKIQWLWEYALFLPKNSVRAIAFLCTLAFLGYLSLTLKGQAQMTIIGGLISVLTSALHYYFDSRERQEKRRD